MSLRAQESRAFHGSIFISTSTEFIDIGVSYLAVKGALSFRFNHTHFKNVFPGRIVSGQVYATSTFDSPVQIFSMSAEDERVITHLAVTQLQPNVERFVGSVVFDASRCQLVDNFMSGLMVPCAECLARYCAAPRTCAAHPPLMRIRSVQNHARHRHAAC